MRVSTLRGTGLVSLALASCMQGGPPSVTPTATLAPKADADSIRTEAPFQVVFSGPHGDLAPRAEAIVTVLFNRPMRTLDVADDANLPAAKITTKDGRPVSGRWHWMGTRGLLFEPDGVFPASSELEVLVPAGTKSLEGATLAAEHRLSFVTSRPTVLAVSSAGRKDVRPDAVFRVELDQPMEPQALEKAARLSVRGKPGASPRSISVKARRPIGLSSIHAPRFVELVPTEKLPLDHEVELVIGKGLAGRDGPLLSEKDQTFAMRTYGPLRLEDVECPRIASGRCQAQQQIFARLSNAVAPKDFLANLSVEGGDGAKLLVEKSAPAPRERHPLVAAAKIGKHYKVTIRGSLRDVFGQSLGKDLVFFVDTEAPMVGAKAGDAANDDSPPAPGAPPPPPSVPHRPKLQFGAQLGITGHVVEALVKDGAKSHVVPASVINVPTVGTWAGALGEAEALRWLDGSARASGPNGGGWAWQWWTPGVGENVRAVKPFDLDALLGGKRGAAAISMFVPGTGMVDTSVLTVTDLAIAARLGKHGGVIWVTRLSTGKPVANASVRIVRLHPKKGAPKQPFMATTDVSGLVTLTQEQLDLIAPKHESAFDGVVLAQSGDDWTYQRIENGRASTQAAGWDVDLQQKQAYRGLLFTERGVYRPGETVKLSGVVRRADAMAMVPPAGKEVKLRVADGEGNELFQTRAKIDAFGTFALDIPLSKTAKLGSASISAVLTGSGGGESFDDSTISTSFLLAAYKASAFKVAVEWGAKSHVRGDTASVVTTGEYLYGAVMENANVRAQLTRASVAFTPPGTDGFVFGEEGVSPWMGAHLGSPEGVLDAKGKWSTELKLALPNQKTAERVTIEAEVEDATRQTVAKSASVLVHPAEFYLALERGGGRFVNAPSGTKVEVKPQVVAFDPSGKRRAGVPVTIELISRKWNALTAEQPDGSAYTTSKPKDEVIATCQATTTATLAGCSLSVTEVGLYFVRATAKDPRGNESIVSTSLYVVTEGKSAPTAAKTDLKIVKMEAEKGTYKVGEKARIMVHSPFAEATALVTVERGSVLYREIVTLKGSMPVVEIPVKSEWFPNVFVSIDLVRGRIKPPPGKGLDLGGPELRAGTTELKVDPESHRLKVALSPTKTQLAPGETLDVDVAVTDANGKPTKGSVTFYAVDEGVLMLTGYKTPDPLPPFAERLRLGVYGFDSREHLAKVLPLKHGEKIPILGWEYDAPDGWSKGSEYGDGEGGGGRSNPRADFRATAFFEAGRVTGDDGKTRFRVKLPDNLTTYRLMAVAASGDDRFGFGESPIVASKKLMLRPALPRIVRVGDVFEASMVLAGKDLPAGDVDVTFKAKGLMVDGPSTARVHLVPGAQVPVRFKVKATAPGPVSIDVEARIGGVSDRVVLSRTVDIPLASKSSAVYGEVTSPTSIALGDLTGIRPDRGGLSVKVAGSALVGLDSSFDRLLEYPYGCTEQLASSTLPLVSLRELAKEAGVRLPANLDTVIDSGIARLLAHQTDEGGFGFWEEEAGVPWLSAYVTFVLEEAAKKGYTVPKPARDRAVAFLRAHLAVPGDTSVPEEEEAQPVPTVVTSAASLQKKNDLTWASTAMIVDALATAGAPEPGTLNRLYDQRAGKPVFAQAFLLHAMAKAKLPQAQLETFAKEIQARLRVGANDVTAAPEGPTWAPMLDSSARTTALVLRAFMAVDPKHPLASRLARGLLNARVDGAWRSTQENVWALVALDAYRVQEKGSKFATTVFLGKNELGHARFEGDLHQESFFVPAAKLGTETVTFDLTPDAGAPAKLFFSAELRWTSSVLPKKALDRGFFIEKRIRGFAASELETALKTLPKTSTSKVKLGELVLVDVLLETSEPRDQVVIDDPLPAGLEPIDIRLETVAKAQAITEGVSLAHGTTTKNVGAFLSPAFHREHHDDRVLTFLGAVSPGMYHFRYLARATATGTFVVPPTSVEAMYAPEISGRTAASALEVVR